MTKAQKEREREERQRRLVLVQRTASNARKLWLQGQGQAALRMLAEAFEGLDEAEGLDPWEAEVFLTWASRQPPDIELAARFLAGVGGVRGVPCDLHEVFLSVDDDARTAIASWAAQPWWLG